jgi:hypothetical protein
MVTWAEFERDAPELATFGRERIQGEVCFQATLLADGAPRLHPVSPWIASGLLLVSFRATSPKIDEVARDGRYALHTPMTNHDGVGGEFLVRGWMEQVGDDHPAVAQRPSETSFPLVHYAMSVEEAVATTYEGPDEAPVYRRWRP